MKVSELEFNKVIPVEATFSDVWDKKGNIVRRFKLNGKVIGCVLNWHKWFLLT